MKQATNSQKRQYYIDALRVFAVFVLIIFHSSKPFDLYEDWNVFNEETTKAANLLQNTIYPWHMQLFILVAGASTWFALRKRTGRQGYSAKVSVTFLIQDAADFALAWLVRDQLRLGLSWPGPQYIVADSQIVETFHWALSG